MGKHRIISIKAIIIGLIVAIGGSAIIITLTGIIIGFINLHSMQHAIQGTTLKETIRMVLNRRYFSIILNQSIQYVSTSSFPVFITIIISGFNLWGGWITGRISKNSEIINSAFTGIISGASGLFLWLHLISSYQIIQLSIIQRSVFLLWIHLLSIPVALLGGYIAYKKRIAITPFPESVRHLIKHKNKLIIAVIVLLIIAFSAGVYFPKGHIQGSIRTFSYSEVIEKNPKNPIAYLNRGTEYFNRHDYDRAISDLKKVVEMTPYNDMAFLMLGSCYIQKEEYDKAIDVYNKAIETTFISGWIYHSRGDVYSEKGEYDKAISDYNKVIELNPNDVSGYNSLANLLATCPDDRYRDGVKAIELAEKALEIIEDDFILDTLAAAYAEAGRFDIAIETQEKAIALLNKEGIQGDISDEYKEHLNSYKANKPWRKKQPGL